MSAEIAITVDTRAGFARVAATFGRMPAATDRALSRALKKLSTWLKRQALRVASQASQIPQKFFERAVRYHVKVTPEGMQVWIGTNPVKAHRLGAVRWSKSMRGARVGRRSFPGTWSWGRGKTGPAVMFRHGDSRLPISVEEVKIHEQILAQLQRVQDQAAERFDRLLTQELNYALNHEASR